jgi:hypothetical protein
LSPYIFVSKTGVFRNKAGPGIRLKKRAKSPEAENTDFQAEDNRIFVYLNGGIGKKKEKGGSR